MIRVEYEGADGDAEFLERDEYHTDKTGMLIAYNQKAVKHGEGVRDKVAIPTNRVIKVVGQ